MGCISSKILTKSLSFREDPRQRSKRNRIPIFTSGNGNGTSGGDHNKFLSKKSALEPTNVEMINTWELMAGLEEDQEVETMSLAANSKIVRRRSKSCHWSLENDHHVFDLGKKGSTSFHTVEEYDAMLERILLSKTQKNVQLKPCGASSSTMNYHQYTQNKNGIQLLSRGKDLVEEDNTVVFTSGPDNDIKEMFPSNTITITIEESTSFKDVVIQERKGLESLQIPSAAELQSIGSLREWLLGGGGVKSPGDYVTPKFGKVYDTSWSEFGEDWKEEPILNPELLAAFQEFIQQIEIEESFLKKNKKIEGNPDEIADKDI